MKFQLIKGGVVVNTIEASQEFVNGLTGYDAVIQNDSAGPGWTWSGGQSFAPPAAPAPGNMSVTPPEFLRLFTPSQRIWVRQQRATDPIVDDFMYLLERSSEVRLYHPDTIAGLTYLTTLNGSPITGAEKDRILAGTAPS